MVKVEISAPVSYSEDTLKNELVRILPIEKSEILNIEIVKRTIEHYKIEDKRSGVSGKQKYIFDRFLRRFTYRRAAFECNISERTAMYWEEDIYFTAECIAEEYQLF